MPRQRLTRERIVQALNELGNRALERGLVLEVVLYGGAAMILAYSNREVTTTPEDHPRLRRLPPRLEVPGMPSRPAGLAWRSGGYRVPLAQDEHPDHRSG
jgi:hypothetical protein